MKWLKWFILRLYNVHSHLIYCIEIYGNTYEKYLSKLMILNSRIYYAPIDTVHVGHSYIQI